MSSKVVFSLTVDQITALKAARDGRIKAEPRCMSALRSKGIVVNSWDGELTEFGELAVALVKGLSRARSRG